MFREPLKRHDFPFAVETIAQNVLRNKQSCCCCLCVLFRLSHRRRIYSTGSLLWEETDNEMNNHFLGIKRRKKRAKRRLLIRVCHAIDPFRLKWSFGVENWLCFLTTAAAATPFNFLSFPAKPNWQKWTRDTLLQRPIIFQAPRSPRCPEYIPR